MNQIKEMLDSKVEFSNIIEIAMIDSSLLDELLQGISPDNKDTNLRYNCHQALLLICEKYPDVLYQRWDYFKKLLLSNHSFAKCNAVCILACLAPVDKENRFEAIFDTYFNLLDDGKVTTANCVAGNAGKVAKANPVLRPKITERLLSIDRTKHDPERRDLIKGYAIDSFSKYFEEAENKEEILSFVRAQLHCSSSKTRKVAEKFLKKHEV